MVIEESRKIIDATKGRVVAICTDGDRTAWARNAAEYGIGLHYIIRALRRGELTTAFCGINGYLEVKRAIKANPEMDRDGAKGLELFYLKLKETRIGKQNEMERMAYTYISKNIIKATWRMITYFENRFLVSCNGSSVASAANQIFNFKNYASNIDVFNTDGLIVGLKAHIIDGESKAKCMFDMLSKNRILPKNVIYIGDSGSDIPALRMVGFPIASPFATDEVKAVAHYVLTDKTTIDVRRSVIS